MIQHFALYILLSIFPVSALWCQTAVNDTVYVRHNYDVVNGKVRHYPDTVKLDLLVNDTGAIKIIAYHVKCTAKVPGTARATIAGFGKIILPSTGKGNYITTSWYKKVELKYTINGKCGTSQATLIILDSSEYYTRDKSKVWVSDLETGAYGYLKSEAGKYYIVYPTRTIQISKEWYDLTMSGK